MKEGGENKKLARNYYCIDYDGGGEIQDGFMIVPTYERANERRRKASRVLNPTHDFVHFASNSLSRLL